MTDDQRTIETNEIEWDGIRIEIRYEPDYPIEATAHIEIRTIAPARFPLPMTETGYLLWLALIGAPACTHRPIWAQAW